MLEISPMSVSQLETVLSWAASEGWNPGLDDAAAFYAADPQGFLIGQIDDTPVAAISVVRHSDQIGFLGLYLCQPAFRGQGLGIMMWQAGLRHLGQRSVGLDGVLAQQDNYKKSGFQFQHRTIRYEGAPPKTAARLDGVNIFTCSGEGVNALVQLDSAIVGYDRPAYTTHWFTDTANRKTLVAKKQGRINGVGTIRTCAKGSKIGPLFAEDAEIAKFLIRALAEEFNAAHIILDVPDHNAAAEPLVKGLNMRPSFETARMFNGPPPTQKADWIFGEATLELG